MRRPLLLVVCAVGLALAGCADDGGGSAPSTEPSSELSSVPSSGLPSSTAATAGASQSGPASEPAEMENVVITFEVEGGYAAQLRSLRLSGDGAAVAEVSGRTFVGTRPREEVETIVAELSGSGLFEDGATHTYPPQAGADLQRYQIGYNGATVLAYDTTVPPELTKAVQLLQAALRGVQR